MESLYRLRDWLESHRELWFELLRIYLGLALFAKGVSFVRQGSVLQEIVRAEITAGDTMIAHYVVAAHVCGGLLLAAGLVTRVAAVVQLPVLLGAALFVHSKEGLFTPHMTLEFTLLVSALLALFTAAGGGRLSADHYLRRSRARAMTAPPAAGTV
jgi:uncharacterized membrane protein YphA (DoxX/SURF4 family)